MKLPNICAMKTLSSLGIGATTLAIIAFPLSQKASAIIGVENFTPSGSLQTSFNGTVGYNFTLNSNDITVNSLGVYDVGGDGLLSSFDVGMWDTNTQALLGSVTVPRGTDAPLVDDWRWANLASSINLNAGQQYTIGALYSGTPSHEGVYFDENLGDEWTSTLITSVDERIASGGGSLTFPSVTGSSNEALLGPNFSTDALGSAASVPFDFSAAPGLLAVGALWGYKKMRNNFVTK